MQLINHVCGRKASSVRGKFFVWAITFGSVFYSLLLFSVFSLLSVRSYGQRSLPVVLDKSNFYSLQGRISYCEDTTLKMRPQEILKLRKENKLIAFNGDKYTKLGFNNSFYWVVVDVVNPYATTFDLFFAIPVPSINLLEMYHYYSGDTKIAFLGKTGDRLPFSERLQPHKDFIFPIHVNPKSSLTLLLKVDKRNQNLHFKAMLGTPTAILQNSQASYTGYGIYAGVFIFALLFNMMLYISVRDQIHLHYSLYIVFSLLLVLDDEGLAKQWLFPDLGRFQDFAKMSYALLACGFFVQVMQSFTDQRRTNSKLYSFTNCYKLVLFGLGVLPIISIWLSFDLYIEKMMFVSTNIFGAITVFIMLICVIERIRNGFKLGYYYLVSILPLLIGTLNYICRVVGLLEAQLFQPNGIVFGLAIEIFLLCFALTQRYNFQKREKARLKKENDQIRSDSIRKAFQAQEDERDRLSKDLHDDLGGTMSLIRLRASAFRQKLEGLQPSDIEIYNDTVALISRACVDLREISHSLKPKFFVENGLISALQERIAMLNNVSNINFELICKSSRNSGTEFDLSIYRIINELTNNIVRHSFAKNATVQLIEDTHSLLVTVEDDGIGFNSEDITGGIGLRNVYSRIGYLGGNYNIDTGTFGTTVTIEIPLDKHV